MIISEKNKYIYICVPKTGTTSVQKFLLEHDSSACRNKILISGKTYKFRDHETAIAIKDKLGELYEQFKVIGFARHPHSKLVSAYHFYQNSKYRVETTKRGILKRMLKIFFTKLVPFKLWCLIYPYKSNKEFLVDQQGKLMVNYVGLYENLNQDLQLFFNSLQIDLPFDELPHINTSTHRNYHEYYTNKLFRYFVNEKVGQDLEFYNAYAKKGETDGPNASKSI